MRNRGRFQAQGNGIEKSEAWAQQDDVYKDNGTDMLDDLETQLTQAEFDDRYIALQKARDFVNRCPLDGVPPLKKTYSNNLQNRAVRIDIEVNAGVAFLTRPKE